MTERTEEQKKKHREYMREWHAQNPDYRRQQYLKHNGVEQARTLRAANPEAARAANRRAYWKNPEKHIARRREHYLANRSDALQKRRAYGLSRYGITVEQYDAMLAAQNGVCAICFNATGEKKYRLSVDHDHTTGRVRGLLCGGCNVTLGHMKDDPQLLYQAMDYLRKYSN